MSGLNKHLENAAAWATLIECLLDKPCTAIELHEQSGLAANTTRKILRVLRRRRRIYVAAWRPDAIGRFNVPAWRLGRLPDALKPMPRTPTQRSAKLRVRRNRDHSDFTKELSVNLHRVQYIVDDKHYSEFATSGDGAGKIRTRVKKLGGLVKESDQVDVNTTRADLVTFLNKKMAHESFVPAAVADGLEKT